MGFPASVAHRKEFIGNAAKRTELKSIETRRMVWKQTIHRVARLNRSEKYRTEGNGTEDICIETRPENSDEFSVRVARLNAMKRIAMNSIEWKPSDTK